MSFRFWHSVNPVCRDILFHRGRILTVLALTLAILIALYLRWQTAPTVRDGWLDSDIYHFVRQARIIEETGELPERDMMRWFPLGRDLSRQLGAFPHCLVWLHRAAQILRSGSSLDDVALVYPLLCIVGSLLIFYLLVKQLFDKMTALLATFLLAIFPTAVLRTTAGYADRDALCLLLGLGLLYSFIHALDAPPGRTRSLLGWSAGVWQVLLNVTWEGSGLFSAMIGTFFVMKVLWGRMNRSYFPLYLGWALPGLTSLLLYTKTYHSLAPYALLAWGAPLFAGLAIGADYTYRYFAAKSGHSFLGFHRLSPGIVAVGSATLVAVGFFSIFVLHTTPLSDVLATLWDNVQLPLGGSRLMLSVGELYDPHSTDWVEWYGISFLVIVAGSTLVVGRTARAWTGDPWVGATLWLVFVGGTVYSRFSPESLSHNPEFSQGIFVSVLVLLGLVLGVGAWWASSRYQPLGPNSGEFDTDKRSIAIIWFTILLLAARGAQRYHLFLAPVAVAFLAHAFVFSIQTLWRRHRLARRIWRWTVVLILSICIGFLSVTAIHRSLAWVRAAQPVLSRPWRNALAWMKQSLPAESVVAAWWDYGSILNLLGEQTTIIDQDHFIPYWIHLMARNVFCASDDEEALTFLRTHQATHLAISSQELALTRTISVIGSDENLDRQTMPPVYLISTSSSPTRPEEEATTIKLSAVRPISADFPLSIQGGQSLAAGEWFVRAGRCELGKNGAVIDASMEVGTTDGRVHIARPQRVHLEHQVLDQKNATLPGTLVLFTATDETAWHAFYVSEKTAELLGVRLLLLGEETPGFQRIYPTSSDERFSQVAIWEIHYPSSILSNSAYLGTEFPNNALRRSWMGGGE